MENNPQGASSIDVKSEPHCWQRTVTRQQLQPNTHTCTSGRQDGARSRFSTEWLHLAWKKLKLFFASTGELCWHFGTQQVRRCSRLKQYIYTLPKKYSQEEITQLITVIWPAIVLLLWRSVNNGFYIYLPRLRAGKLLLLNQFHWQWIFYMYIFYMYIFHMCIFYM